MKKVLLLATCLSMFAGAALADHIGLYREAAGTNCFRSPWNPDGAANFVFVVQKFNTNSSGSEFMINNLSGAPFSSFVLGNAAFLNIGQPHSGISVSYGSCIVVPTFTILRLNYADDNLEGLAPVPCGKMEVVEDPGAVPPVRQTSDCGSIPHLATGGTFYWGTGCPSCADPTATAATTWGGVKALYR